MVRYTLLTEKEATIKILVTGASGHIGYHICKLLISKGYEVKAFIRPSSFREHLLKLPLNICYGDILKIDTLRKGMEGVEVIFHTAAIYEFTQSKEDNLVVETATQGTKNLYLAACESGVKKIIHTSSVETVGLSYDKNIFLNESNFTKKAFYTYSIAKIESEIITLELARKFNLYTVICNPSTVIGKDDYKPTPSNKMLLNYAKYNLFYVESGQSLVDVEDVANGHLNAYLYGRSMERYILSGENIEVKNFIILIRRILNIKIPFIKLNKFVLYPAAFLFETSSKVTNKEPFFTKQRLTRAMGSYSYYDCSKARQELGYSPRKLIETLSATLSWLLERYR